MGDCVEYGTFLKCLHWYVLVYNKTEFQKEKEEISNSVQFRATRDHTHWKRLLEDGGRYIPWVVRAEAVVQWVGSMVGCSCGFHMGKARRLLC